MPKIKYQNVQAMGTDAVLKVAKGHFATTHAHTNYYIDMTTLRAKTNEAEDVARTLSEYFVTLSDIDTILCMEGTQVIGAYLAQELTKNELLARNRRRVINVLRPEINNNSQILIRENMMEMVEDQDVIALLGMVTTGQTASQVVESIQYYGGRIQGIAAVFSFAKEANGIPIRSVFSGKDIPDYESYDYRECPLCKSGKKLDALVNAYGYQLI